MPTEFLLKFLTSTKNESPKIERIRKNLKDNFGNWAKCLEIVKHTKDLPDELEMITDLCEGKDVKTVVKRMKLSGFCVHSYSSYIFNAVLSSRLKKKYGNIRIAKLGNNCKFDKGIMRMYLPIMKKEGICLDDFKRCYFDIHGHYRDALFYPKNMNFCFVDNGIIIMFTLGNGQYASLLLNFLIDSKNMKLN